MFVDIGQVLMVDLAAAFPSMNSHLHTYTPVRRRDSTVNTRNLHGAEQEQEWTAARCHRLLRALTSRVAILKKDLVRFQSAGKTDSGDGKLGASPESKVVDADWTRSKKPIRQTYSGRGGRNGPKGRKNVPVAINAKKERKSISPGEVTIPTPLLARARGEIPLPQPFLTAYEEPRPEDFKVTKRPRGRGPEGTVQFQPSETLREIRQTTSAARYTTYEGIYNGLEGLLRATTSSGSEDTTRGKGARSLLSMTLKAVPKYITQQEGLLEAHMEETGGKTALNQRDIATEIYDELESFGSSNRGWRKLRTIVRAHGIDVISGAIHLGLLDDGFCGILIALCINTFAIEEAQSLLSALLSSKPYPGPKTLYDTPSRPLSMLWKFTGFTSRSSFQFRELSSILTNGTLPVEWLATKEFGPTWTTAIQLLFPGSKGNDAFDFLKTALFLLLQAGQSPSSATKAVTGAVKTTFSSLLTTLTSISILSREARNGSTVESSEDESGRHAVALLEGCLARAGLWSPSDAQISLLLSNLIICESQDILTRASLMNAISTQLRSNNRASGVTSAYNEAVAFIGQIARCCGRGSSSPGFEHLKQIHLMMEILASDNDGSSAVQGLIVDSAFAFAQKVPDGQHLEYAACMDAKFCARRPDVDSSWHEIREGNDSEAVSGYRWEEGIGEWVTATPAVIVAKRKAAALRSFEDDSECDTPYRPPPKLRRQTEAGPTCVPAAILASVVQPSSPLVSSSPNFDHSIGSNSSENEDNDEASTGIFHEDDFPVQSNVDTASDGEDSSQGNSGEDEDDNEASEGILHGDDFPSSEDEDCNMESSSDESFVSHSSPASTPPTASRMLPPIARVPRLSRKLLRTSQDCQLFDDCFSSTASLATSHNDSLVSERREFVDRAPRLGRKALCSSQACQMFDESDDELSILSTSSHAEHALRDVANTGVCNARRSRKTSSNGVPMTRARASKVICLSDSEDELCL